MTSNQRVTLIEKLDRIHKPSVRILQDGTAGSIEEFWEKVVLPNIPQRDVVLRWHELLMQYVMAEHPIFVIRGYNTLPPECYNDLRRGFLTQTKDFSFVYTDNFFASYIQKLIIDGFIPSLNEFMEAFKSRQFPRLYRTTKEEKQLMAYKQGRDPGIWSGGYKLAHIIPVGKEYKFNGQDYGSTEILENYFPKGQRDDWKLVHDTTGNYFRRDMIANQEAKKFAIAYFLRFVHPFNYFLCPKKNCEDNNECKELAEYASLLDYAHDYNLNKYGETYKEFLSYIMPDKSYYSNRFDNNQNRIDIQYGINLTKNNNSLINEIKQITPELIKDIISIYMSVKYPDSKDEEIKNALKDFNISINEIPQQKQTFSAKQTNTNSNLTHIILPEKVRAASGDNKQFVFNVFNSLNDKGLLNKQLLNCLCDKNYSQRQFKLSYPVFVSVLEFEKKDYERCRFYKNEFIIINGIRYFVCSQWTQTALSLLKEWYEKILNE